MLADRVNLRPTEAGDLPVLFDIMDDPAVRHMAAFGSGNAGDWPAFEAKYLGLLANPDVTTRTIEADGAILGYIALFALLGHGSVGYTVGKAFWGQGVATRALALFLGENRTRPLYARVAFDNAASLKVLERNGFVVVGRDRDFAAMRGEELEELVLVLSDTP